MLHRRNRMYREKPMGMVEQKPGFPQTTEALEILLRQQMVFDIGQIPEPLKKWMDKHVRKGRVQKLWNTQRFPNGKFCYWIVDGEPPLQHGNRIV